MLCRHCRMLECCLHSFGNQDKTLPRKDGKIIKRKQVKSTARFYLMNDEIVFDKIMNKQRLKIVEYQCNDTVKLIFKDNNTDF